MEVVRLPKEFKRHLWTLFLFIPIPALEGMWLNHEWKIRLEWFLWPALFLVPFAFFMQKNARWSRGLSFFFAAVGTAWCAWSYQRATHGADIILSLLVWVKFGLVLVWSYRAWKLWNQTYLRSDKKWYEGEPRAIPHLYCQIKTGAKPAKVNRIDRQGLILFNLSEEFALQTVFEVELAHQASSKKVVCQAEVVGRQMRPLVLGLKFKDLTPDQRKDLGDFVEKLKGEGYADLNGA